MKNSILLLSMLIFAVACSKNNDGEKDDCIDVSQINNSGVCYEVYAPVCGCNNETYENDSSNWAQSAFDLFLLLSLLG